MGYTRHPFVSGVNKMFSFTIQCSTLAPRMNALGSKTLWGQFLVLKNWKKWWESTQLDLVQNNQRIHCKLLGASSNFKSFTRRNHSKSTSAPKMFTNPAKCVIQLVQIPSTKAILCPDLMSRISSTTLLSRLVCRFTTVGRGLLRSTVLRHSSWRRRTT